MWPITATTVWVNSFENVAECSLEKMSVQFLSGGAECRYNAINVILHIHNIKCGVGLILL